MDEKIHTWVCDIVDENAPMIVDRNEAMITVVVVTVDGNTRKQSQKKKNKERKHFVEQLWKFRRRRPTTNIWEKGA